MLDSNALNRILFRLTTAFFGTLLGFSLSFLHEERILNPANPLWWTWLNLQVAAYRSILIFICSTIYLVYWYFMTKRTHWMKKRHELLNRGWWWFYSIAIFDLIMALLPYVGYFLGEITQQRVFPQWDPKCYDL